MKCVRRWRYAAIIAIATSLPACGASGPIRIAVSGDYAPFSSTTSYGANVGFDATVAAQFARDNGRKMYFVPLRWPRLIEQAQTNQFDVAMSGVTMRADRIPSLFFSRPYAVTGAVVAVRRERKAELGTLAQIDRLGIRIAVNRGGHLERVARARFDKAEILTVDDNRMLADLVLRGEVDAAVSEQLEVRAWPVDAFAVIGPFSRDRKVYAVTPQRIDVLQRLNHWLMFREDDGWLNDERRRWLGEAAAWTPDEACFEAIAAAIDLRMELMPRVAAAKRQRNLPIEDIAQEKLVLAQVAEWATEAGVEVNGAVALFDKLIAAAKEVQRASLKDDRGTLDDADLDALRVAIAFYSRRIIDEAAGCKAALQRTKSRPALEAALHAGDSPLMSKVLPAADLAALLRNLAPHGKTVKVSANVPAVSQPAPIAGSYVEFCVPPNVKFDRQGYIVHPLMDGKPVTGGAPFQVQSGRTRIPTAAGDHEYWLYVSGSSADPKSTGGARTAPVEVEIDVPENGAMGVRYTPIVRPTGQVELRWVEGSSAAAGPYHSSTRFDVEVEIYDPNSASAIDRCPW